MLAVEAGHQVEVICFEFDNWSKILNDALKKNISSVNVITIPAGRKPFFGWALSAITETVFRFLGKLISLPVPVLSQAVSRRSILLIKAFPKASKPDWVIGHNPGALWPAHVAGKKFDCKIGFDVEDYHPGEGHNSYHQRLSKNLMCKILPLMNYVSFASPLIKKAVAENVVKEQRHWFTVLNYFSSKEFIAPPEVDGPVKMVWFSQNINSDRGLELVLPYIKSSPCTELHLYGNVHSSFFENYLKGAGNIYIHAPLPQKKLHQHLSTYDIGLALEPSKDINNELAVSNKLLAYLQAGLFVVATNTKAQTNILEHWPEHGECFDHKKNHAAEIMEKIVIQIDAIREKRKWRYQHFSNHNWENESKTLLNAWQD